MTFPSALRGWLVVLATLAMPEAAAAEEPQGAAFRGATLPEALERLEGAGLEILYSSDLVRPSMKVLSEPRGRWPREILDEILTPHGLRAQPGPAGTILIVPAPAPGSIRGVVVLARTGEPLAGVRVAAQGTSITSVTDAQGEFATDPLPAGRYALEFALGGLLRQRLAGVQVKAGAATAIRFEMDPRVPSSEEVVVHGDDPRTHGRGPETRQSLGRDELRGSPDLGTDPLQAVERLAGVSEADGRGTLHVRGGASDETSIVVDGLELYAPYHLLDRGGLVSAIDSRNIAGIELLGGAFPAEYGGHLSGVVEMDTVVPPDDLAAEVAYTTNDARLAGQGRFDGGDGYWLVSARRGDPSMLLDALATDPSYEPQYWDLFAKAGARLGRRTTLSADVLRSYDDVEGGDRTRVETVYDPGTFRSQHRSAYAWLTLENTWSRRWVTRTQLSFGRLGTEREGSSARVAVVEDGRSAGLLGLAHQAWFDSGRHLLKWGGTLQQLEASYHYVSSPTVDGLDPRNLTLHPQGIAFSGYAADRIRVTDALRLEIGVRWDERSYVSGDGSWAPRLNLDYALGDRTRLVAGWGHFDQAPRIHELAVQDGAAEFFPAQRAEHRLAGIEHVLRGGEQIGVVAYQKLVDDPTPRFENVFDPSGFFPEAGADRLRIDPTRGRAEGIEVTARGAMGQRLGWRASYALARAEDEIGGAWVPCAWDQRHAVDFGLAWRLAEHWDIRLAGIYHSGQPTTPVSGEAVDPVVGARNSARLPDYLRFDARLGRRFVVRGTTLATFVNVTNLLDRQNACCLEGMRVELDDGAPRVEPQIRSGLPRLVTAGLSWTF